jgi:Mn2+/Fe2+ NRAMP family transporter
MMVAPLLVGDWRDGRMRTDTPVFRVICLVAAAWGLVIPAVGSNPVSVTILAQISNVFVLPLTVGVILWLVNRRDVMGGHKAGWLLNALLVAAFLFSLAVAYVGAKTLAERLPALLAVFAGIW